MQSLRLGAILNIKGDYSYLIPAKGEIFDRNKVSSIASPCQQHMFHIDASVGGGASQLIINLTIVLRWKNETGGNSQ
jgi:hypothetical protein